VVAKQLNMSSLCNAVVNRTKELWCVHKNRIPGMCLMSPHEVIAMQWLGLVSVLQKR